MEAVVYIGVGSLIWIIYYVYWVRRFLRLEKNVRLIMGVLSKASPELERRVIEQGPRVTFSEKWEDDSEDF